MCVCVCVCVCVVFLLGYVDIGEEVMKRNHCFRKFSYLF